MFIPGPAPDGKPRRRRRRGGVRRDDRLGRILASVPIMAFLARVVTSPAAALALTIGVCCAAAAVADTAASEPPDFSREALDRRAPIIAERSYTLKAGVRVLVFWIRRDNVGSGRITWRAGDDGHRVFEFLVGSDPARAAPHQPLGVHRRRGASAQRGYDGHHVEVR